MTKKDVIDYCLSLINTFEDHPFSDDFDSVVLKHKENNKWFGLIMNFNGKEFLNVKTDPEYSELLRKTYDYIIPAYHMNKVHWNTIILSDDIDEELVKELILQSYELTKNKIKKL